MIQNDPECYKNRRRNGGRGVSTLWSAPYKHTQRKPYLDKFYHIHKHGNTTGSVATFIQG